MRDEMKRTMFELFGVGSEDDKVLAAGGKKPAVKPEPVKTAPVQAPVQPVVKAKAASYLAAGTSLEGTLRSDGDVEIAGAFKGRDHYHRHGDAALGHPEQYHRRQPEPHRLYADR